MSLIRFLLILFLFYFLYKIIQYFYRIFISNSKRDNITGQSKNVNSNPKYKDVEEAQFTEIEPTKKTEEQKQK